MINPAKAAAEFLSGSAHGEYGNALRSHFSTQVGQPANYNYSPAIKITADYANTEFTTVSRVRPSSAPTSDVYAAGSLRPALGGSTKTFARADELYAQKLNAIADSTLNAFSATASGKPSLTPVAHNPAVPSVNTTPARPQAPVSYAALEIDMA